MRILKKPASICGFFIIICIVMIGYFSITELVLTPKPSIAVGYILKTPVDNERFIKVVNSGIDSDPWDYNRTSTIKQCRDMISGVPEAPPPFLPDLKNPCWYAKSGKFRCLPYFFIIGMVKCGTSDLNSHVVSHPDIAIGRKGNQFWFDRRFYFSNGEFKLKPIQQYLKYFSAQSSKVLEAAKVGSNHTIFSDSTAATLYDNKYWGKFRENCNLKEPKYTTADYIHHLVPKAKIIAILRNPTDRAYSSYCFFRRRVKTPDDFHVQCVKAIVWFERCVRRNTVRGCAYDPSIGHVSQVRIIVGLYYVYIEDYMKVFSPQQVMVIRFEDYIKDRLSAVKSIYNFLDLRPMTSEEEQQFLENDIVVQSNSKLKDIVGPMRNDTRKLLNDFFRKYNIKLAKLLDNERYIW